MVRFPHACISRLHPKSGLSCLYKFGECLKDDQSWGRLISTLPFLITGGKFEISRRSNFVRVVPPALLAYLVEEPRDNNLEARSDYKPAKLPTICYKSHRVFCSKRPKIRHKIFPLSLIPWSSIGLKAAAIVFYL